MSVTIGTGLMKLGLRGLTAEMMCPYIGKTFLFEGAPGLSGAAHCSLHLELLEVMSHERLVRMETADPEHFARRERDPFSLLFVLKEDEPAPGQGLYQLRHEAFEPEAWFLSRVQVNEQDVRRAYYEAVFA